LLQEVRPRFKLAVQPVVAHIVHEQVGIGDQPGSAQVAGDAVGRVAGAHLEAAVLRVATGGRGESVFVAHQADAQADGRQRTQPFLARPQVHARADHADDEQDSQGASEEDGEDAASDVALLHGRASEMGRALLAL